MERLQVSSAREFGLSPRALSARYSCSFAHGWMFPALEYTAAA